MNAAKAGSASRGKQTIDRRRRNLQSLADTHGQTSIAKRSGWSGPSYVSQLISGGRPLNEKTAAKIEKAMGLDLGWLDQDHEPPPAIDMAIVTLLMSTIARIADRMNVALSQPRIAKLTQALYPDAAKAGAVDERRIAGIVEALRDE